ncbi:phospholipase/carboxylesterase [Povalibacter uvarum]|uniref:Phospholipase/carboxylesterase n=1 Tax=Povalibacter uvarum TaxID=732238 RepID=A0A841HLD9_9GAMM|nr:alpha/beta fold hydrolase [Povalibacter uvarum]MBB6093179.1 phospholipase/carboxylesterase [Povalibacter uvarum]
MPYSATESESHVILDPSAAPTAAVIWLHGLGADGYDFVPVVEELKLPATLPVRFIFPHARQRPVTINNGYVMRAWYDIKSLGGGSRVEDDAGIRESAQVVGKYIEEQVAAGIGANRIVIAGFSQGGAIALHTALRYPQRLAGIMALSTYLPLQSSVASEASGANRDIPILMCHGTYDQVVPAAMGVASRDLLQKLNYAIDWQAYPMEHSVCMEEIGAISSWLQKQLAS